MCRQPQSSTFLLYDLTRRPRTSSPSPRCRFARLFHRLLACVHLYTTRRIIYLPGDRKGVLVSLAAAGSDGGVEFELVVNAFGICVCKLLKQAASESDRLGYLLHRDVWNNKCESIYHPVGKRRTGVEDAIPQFRELESGYGYALPLPKIPLICLLVGIIFLHLPSFAIHRVASRV